MEITIYSACVIQSSSEMFLVRCGRCDGKGENNREYECRVCRGTGKVFLNVPKDWEGRDVGVLKCGRCNGSGENNQEYFCRVCKGVGALVKCFPRIVCSRCAGTGENNKEYFCSSCYSAGSIWIDEIMSY